MMYYSLACCFLALQFGRLVFNLLSDPSASWGVKMTKLKKKKKEVVSDENSEKSDVKSMRFLKTTSSA